MKTLTITAFLLSATAAMAGPTENITGCATVAVEGSNYTTFADPHCYSAPEGGSGFDAIIANWAVVKPEAPVEEEPEEVAAD